MVYIKNLTSILGLTMLPFGRGWYLLMLMQ
uniref:Uncharacterized protein n=1 Tax=Rhizophora mucronata TaxID=61149 RepID=A0A2P2L474_RHIMU